jgi:hypothetical protein
MGAKNLCITEGNPERNFGLLLFFIKIMLMILMGYEQKGQIED